MVHGHPLTRLGSHGPDEDDDDGQQQIPSGPHVSIPLLATAFPLSVVANCIAMRHPHPL